MSTVDITTVSSDAKSLVVFLEGVLQSVIDAFDGYNTPLPERRYWCVGTPAIDCEQVVLSLAQIYIGPPGEEATSPQRCSSPRSAVIRVTVARNAPVVDGRGRPPTAETIQLGSEISAVDAWILLDATAMLDQWEGAAYGIGVIGSVDMDDTQGGLQSVTATFTLAMT
jgi:hypothetical protein